MAKAKKEVFKTEPLIPTKLDSALSVVGKIPIEVTEPLNVSEMTIIEIMHQKNISREDAISFIRTNQNKK